MIFVLTNDDGIDSPKIKYTKSVLEKFGTVYTVAPKIEQSAKSMSITIGGFGFTKIDEFNYAIEGTPVDCISFALNALQLKPDVIFSGTNNGYNIGIDIKYSGTVGACLAGQYFGYPTIALSADRNGNSILEVELEKTIKHILVNKLYSKDYTLNVNFPREKFGQSNGVLDTTVFHQQFSYNSEIKGNKFIPNRKFIIGQNTPKNSDTWAYANGYTSISKIKI